MIAPNRPIRAPVRIVGSAAGITIAKRFGAPSAAADHRSCGATWDVPAAVASRIGNTASKNPSATFEPDPSPKTISSAG